MANKLVSITTIPTRSDSDTVASYNVYTDKPSANTLVGTLTPAEALAGKSLTFADGLIHNATAKTVWTTAGESITNVSNIVVVDLTVVSTLLFQDNFNAASLDAAKWTDVVTDAGISVAFSGSLDATYSAASNSVFYADYYIGKTAYPIPSGGVLVLGFNVITTSTNTTDNYFSCGLSKETDLTTNLNTVSVSRSGNLNKIVALYRTAGVNDFAIDIIADYRNKQYVKVVISETQTAYYLWDGSAWVSELSNAIASSGSYYPFISVRDLTTSNGLISIDDFTVANEDYATLNHADYII